MDQLPKSRAPEDRSWGHRFRLWVERHLRTAVERGDATNEATWRAHALQAVGMVTAWSSLALLTGDPYLIGAGVFFSEGAWTHREVSDFINQWMEMGWEWAVAHLREDGLPDLIWPHLAAVVTALVFFLAFGLIHGPG